ncbi:MAG: phosphodiesterase [Candidatus Hydrogenedentes bacterium ADurb.Bin179]|nr:MAG: phosphodiesterase [Candidatus Hydrogenedentes bacterium ADurb.Bin179]
MILGVLSDTHGNLPLMRSAAAMLTKQLGATQLIHLGDDWEDKEDLDNLGYFVSGVPGLWCDAYRDPHIPRVRLDVFDGLAVAYAHDRKELQSISGRVGLLLSGHTHQSVIDEVGGVPHMNPGHLSRRRGRGQETTFGRVAIKVDRFILSIYGLDGEVHASRTFLRGKSKKGVV